MKPTANPRPYREWRDFLRMKRFVRPYAGPLLLMICISLIGGAMGLAQPYLSKYLVDNALMRRDMHALFVVAGLMFATTVGGVVLNFISGYGYIRLSSSMLFDMRLEVYRHLHTLSPRFFARSRLGDLVSRLNGDVAEVQRISADSFLSSLSNVLFAVGSLVMMVWLSWKLFVVGIVLVPGSVWLFHRYQVRITALVRELRERSAEIGTLFVETLLGNRLVACFNASDFEMGRFGIRNKAFVSTLLRFQRTSLLGRTMPGTILTIATIAVFLYGGRQIILGQMTIGTLVAFMAYHARLLSPIQNLLGLSASLSSARVSLGRVLELLDTSAEVVERPGASSLLAIRKGLELRDVTVRHEDRTVLNRVSLEIPAGRFSVFVGSSGAGKSTIADLFVRLLDPESGTVLIDGVDVRMIKLQDLRRKVVLIEQSPHLMHGTLLWNISYPQTAISRVAVEAAAEAAGLGELMRRLPEGLDTIAGERGLTLSTGERQRVAIARAFLSDPEVIILDEPSAALDLNGERELLDNLRWRFAGKTMIVITHKPHMALAADHIVHIENGSVVHPGVAA